MDLGKKESVSQIVEYLTRTGGTLDILVNNAGITRDKTLAKMPPESWDAVLRINTEVPLELSESLLEAKRLSDQGRILFLSSVVGIAGTFGQTNYSASKSALIGIVASLCDKVAANWITVNAIAPGFIETPMTGKMPLMMRQFGRRLSSLRQGGIPEDVAQLATFLASPCAYGITGATIRVCGQAIVG
jgi:3-oxoacyl-[acyl-carrier protein] reductase